MSYLLVSQLRILGSRNSGSMKLTDWCGLATWRTPVGGRISLQFGLKQSVLVYDREKLWVLTQVGQCGITLHRVRVWKSEVFGKGYSVDDDDGIQTQLPIESNR